MKKLTLTSIALFIHLPFFAIAQSDTTDSTETQEPISISGFIDVSASMPFTGPKSEQKLTFGVNQIELDFESSPLPGLTVGTDLNVFPGAGTVNGNDLVEQAFMQYYFNGASDGFYITLGKINAPVGIEVIDPTDMYQYSSGLLFDHATPGNLMGVFSGWTDGTINVMAWVSNDWDMAGTADLPNLGGRFEYGLTTGHVGLSTTYEQEPGKLMLDFDTRVQLGDFTFFAEANMWMVNSNLGLGALGKVNYEITDALSTTLRFDYLDHSKLDGYKAMSATGAFLIAFNKSLLGGIEVRAEMPDKQDTQLTGALQLIASF